MLHRLAVPALVLLTAGVAVACRRGGAQHPYPMHGPLVAANATMVAAWDVPQSPLNDQLIAGWPLADQVRRGYQIFTDTPANASRFTHSRMSCTNCHLNAGQRERALPLVGVAGGFPEFNKRAARLISVEDRVIDCFMRSENGATGPDAVLPTASSDEVLAVSAYLAWLARGYEIGRNPSWRGQNTIAADKLIPVAALDPARGEALYTERCTACHGADGQGVQIGDKKAGPLWGPDSWNDGAGAARVYTLAGIIRYSMPYLDPGSLTDEEAQQIARFITAKPRPAYPFKTRDYRGSSVPPDAVYYRP